MKSTKCNKCKEPINQDDKFCQHCGSPIEKHTPTPQKKAPKESIKLSFSTVSKWILVAVILGLLMGWVRYWIGYYVLVQGVIVGLLIPWIAAKKTTLEQKEALANVRFKIAIVLFFSFMIAQGIGFGVAQPVFDPLIWLARVWDGQTSESVFGIFSTGGVVHEAFSGGLSGGFWVLLSFIDLFFMFFFILVSMPLPTNKKRS